MKANDRLWLVGLLAGAAYIWLRDRRWMAEADDVIPALAAIPLALWLGQPWAWRTTPRPVRRPLLIVAGLGAMAGIALHVTLLLAAAWTALLWAWLGSRLPEETLSRAARLLVLPFNAFPWVTLDLQPVGWWFRLTGAQTAETLYRILGFPVTRDGTHLVIQGAPISVDASCAGLHAFQAMLIAGSLLAFVLLGAGRAYWWNIVLLPPLAWCANTLRIVTITAASVTWGQEFAMGLFHTWGGLFAIALMFAASGLVFQFQARHLVAPRPLPAGA